MVRAGRSQTRGYEDIVVRLLPDGFRKRKGKERKGKGGREVSGFRPSPSTSSITRGGRGLIRAGEVDFEEAREGYHEKYGGALEVDADRVVNEEWSSSFCRLRMRTPKDEERR